MHHKKKTISCGTVVYRINAGALELLLIKQSANKDAWGIPKGHIKPGETYEQCATRETHEETGICVQLHERLPDIISYYKNEEKTVVSFIATQTCTSFPNSTHPESEVSDAQWFPINSLPKTQFYQQPLLQQVICILKLKHE